MDKRACLTILLTCLSFLAAACGGSSAGVQSSPSILSATSSLGAAVSPTTVSTPPTLSVSPPPWPAPVSDELARIVAAGLPALRNEELAYHVHAHLDVFVNGAAITVPANIGIDNVARVISPLHTHDSTGIIHVESAQPKTFTLGQFFTEWGVRLNATCVAVFCSPETPIKAYVNGATYSGDLAQIEIKGRAEIALVVGSAPSSVPSKYDFPPGY